jgi:aconitate hydratase
MGVLPLQFKEGENAESLGLSGRETFHIEGLSNEMAINSEVVVRAEKADGSQVTFSVLSRLDTALDVQVYRNGGILHSVIRELL